MKIVFAGSIPKENLFPNSNEDAFKEATEQGLFALSDGASESYDSKTWSNLLVDKFIEKPEIDTFWVIEAITQFETHFDVSNLSWSKKASFDRGSFATLLGIEYFPDYQNADILAIGDSLAVLLDGEKFIRSFPYQKAKQFENRPELLSTNISENSFIKSSTFFIEHLELFKLNGLKRPIILCMTDALGEWAFRCAESGIPVWEELLKITDMIHFEELVFSLRNSKRIRTDDTTLVHLSFNCLPIPV